MRSAGPGAIPGPTVAGRRGLLRNINLLIPVPA